ncbi:MAG: c-type cytochrome [Chloroflexi bacterium]|nr:c-type cytochrome [Chloroflexota bacterium]
MDKSLGRNHWLVLALIGGLVLTFVAVGLAAAEPSADAAKGKELFAAKLCANCHGQNAEGGFGPTLAGTQRTLAQVTAKARAKVGNMPGFSEAQVSDAEIADIVDFLKSTPAPATRGTYAFSTKEGDPAGQVIFVENGCAACHRIPPSVAGTRLDAAQEITQVRTPRARMPSFTAAQISDADVTTVNEWLRSMPAPAAAPKPQPPAETKPQAPVAPSQPAPTTLPRTGDAPENLLRLLVILGGLGLAAGLVIKMLAAQRA